MPLNDYICQNCHLAVELFDDELSMFTCGCGADNLKKVNPKKAYVWVGHRTYSHWVIKPDSLESRRESYLSNFNYERTTHFNRMIDENYTAGNEDEKHDSKGRDYGVTDAIKPT